MRLHHQLFPFVFTLMLAACQSRIFPAAAPLNAFPQYGHVSAPGGTYFTQQDGPWGSPAGRTILVAPSAGGAPTRPSWSDAAVSESAFYYNAVQKRYCLIRSGAGDNSDIWCGEYSNGDWQPPVRLPPPVNSSSDEYSPIVTNRGDICFASARAGGAGMGDLYCAARTDGAWKVTPLGSVINTSGGEWNLDISPDGNLLVFEASHRETNRTIPGDLYLSRRTPEGWGIATPLTALNTDGSDLLPRFDSNNSFTFTTVENGISRQRRVRLVDR